MEPIAIRTFSELNASLIITMVGQAEFSFQKTGFSVIIQFVVDKQNRRSYTGLPDTIGVIQRVVIVTEHSLLTRRQSNEIKVQWQEPIIRG